MLEIECASKTSFFRIVLVLHWSSDPDLVTLSYHAACCRLHSDNSGSVTILPKSWIHAEPTHTRRSRSFWATRNSSSRWPMDTNRTPPQETITNTLFKLSDHRFTQNLEATNDRAGAVQSVDVQRMTLPQDKLKWLLVEGLKLLR